MPNYQFYRWVSKEVMTVQCEIILEFQVGHIPAKMKFPVFSLSFPCVT